MSARSTGSRSRSRSPSSDHDGSPEKRASKKRKVLSCYACRNRKMKCDRLFPVCGRCARTGRAEQCSYDPRLVEEFQGGALGHSGMNGAGMAAPSHAQISMPFMPPPPHGGAPTSDSVAWKMQMQQQRIEMLEKKLAGLDTSQSTLGTGFSQDDETPNNVEPPKESMMFRGSSFKTHFYGSTSPMALLVQFPEVHVFTKGAMTSDSAMARIKADFKSFRARRKVIKASTHQPGQYIPDADILALIPPKDVVYSHVLLYFQNYENTYRILHRGSFWREFERFSENPADSESCFYVTLLLVMATVRCLSDEGDKVFLGDSSSGREEAGAWIEAAETWVARQSRKHLTLPFFQVQCLLILARRINSIKVKQDWIHTGELIRCGMSAGLHRDPALLNPKKTDEFTKEMRRRIWATMMELELQACLEKGMQSCLTSLSFDCPVPANAEDSVFCTGSASAPLPQTFSDFTSSSYLHISRRSLPLRIHLTSLLNTPKGGLQYEDVIHYDAQLNAAIAALPNWTGTHTQNAAILLDLQLRQFLLILHQPFTKLAGSNPRYAYSTTATLSAGSKILMQHTTLTAAGSHMLNMLRNDVFRAAISLGQAIYAISVPPVLPLPQNGSAVNRGPPREQPEQPDINDPDNPLKYPSTSSHPPLALLGAVNNISPISSNFLLTTIATAAAPLLDTALEIFESKALRLGTGYMEYWIMAAAAGLAAPAPAGASGTEEDAARARGQKAIEKITRLCYKVLALQPSVGSELGDSLRAGLGVDGAQSSGAAYSSAGGQAGGSGPGAQLGGNVGTDGTNANGGGMMDIGLGVRELDDLPPFDTPTDNGLGWAWTDFWEFDMGDL
ncbi:uncharacterized protein BDZ99DRAFT_575485 [Mytilinidion resinicola]|uniref:Zn(2)-C6 fungal-type domain-containing protein n=1 Tax=Mytilinidion resinicola TaxID=574789 RepID=A0A6A6Y8M2_9PEZI|nr:uncharacterized protein BDZ99DRAFT_575485 [Mytilinidion resinicola]KAF2804167.1 hypothetical protein BDZ99DRAFT_575485 [Mytilinidion resinicola]